MSTKSTIFLTEDNDEDCAFHHFNPINGMHVGDSIFIEIDKNSLIGAEDYNGEISIVGYITLEFKPGTEIYNLIKNIKQ